MKQKVIITAFIGLTLASQLTIAGSITDTYITGDTLTATKMDTIKNAVNDNDNKISTNTTGITDNSTNINIKQERVSGTCTAGSSIREINTDGTVVCEIDMDTNTTYTAGTGITINDTTISITATTEKTDYYFITGSELEPVGKTDETQWSAYDLTGQYAFPTNRGDKVVGHGVRLPNGSKITDMRCYYYDNDPTYNMDKFDFSLYERTYLDRTFGIQITPPNDAPATTGASTAIKQLIEAGLNHIVDNDNNAYYMRLRFGIDNSSYTSFDSNDIDDSFNPRSDTSNLRTYGCRITYKH